MQTIHPAPVDLTAIFTPEERRLYARTCTEAALSRLEEAASLLAVARQMAGDRSLQGAEGIGPETSANWTLKVVGDDPDPDADAD